MQNLKIFEKSQPIVDCSSYEKDGEVKFDLMIIETSFSGELSPSGKKIPTRTVKSFRVNKKNLPEDLQKFKNDEICQALKGKSLLTTTSISG